MIKSGLLRHKWVRQFSSAGNVEVLGVGFDGRRNIIIAGLFQGTVNFAAAFSGTDNKISTSTGDLFITRINRNGTYGWTRVVGNGNAIQIFNSGKMMVVDWLDNIYITGTYEGTMNFRADFGGTDNKTSTGLKDMFIMSLTSSGSYGWTRVIGSSDPTRTVEGRCLTWRATFDSDDVWVAGSFQGPIDFAADFGGSDTQGTGTTARRGYVTRITTAGAYVGTYVYEESGIDPIDITSIEIDQNPFVYVSGHFQGTVNFAAPFGGTDNKVATGIDAFMTAFDSATPAYLWSRRIGNVNWTRIKDVFVDDDAGSLTIAGEFTGTLNLRIDFDGGTDNKVSGGIHDIYLIQTDFNGAYYWGRSIGAGNIDTAFSIVGEQWGGYTHRRIFLGGIFFNTVDFAADFGGSDIKISAGSSDGFVTEIYRNGTYGTTRQYSNVDEMAIFTLGLAPGTDLLIGGNFEGTLDTGVPWETTDSRTAAATKDGFIQKVHPRRVKVL